MNNKSKTRDATVAQLIRLPRSSICFTCSYPQENQKDAVDSIVDALTHAGVFDRIKSQ